MLAVMGEHAAAKAIGHEACRSTGCERCSAWIWLFSSTHSTTACSGGSRYSPTALPTARPLRGLESQGIDYVARIRNNAVLDRMACPYLRRPPGRPPREGRTWCHELRYQADTWEHARRVVLVVVERPGELLLDYFWLITNLRADRYSGARLLGLYRMRGKAEGHMGELMDVLAPALSSVRRPIGDGCGTSWGRWTGHPTADKTVGPPALVVAVHVSTDYLRPRRRARSPPALAQPTLSPWSASRSDPDHPSQTCRHS